MRHLIAALLLLTLAPAVPLAAPGPRAGAEPTYLVFGPLADLTPLPPGVRLVGPAAGGVLVAGPPRAVESLAERGLDLVRLADGATAPPAPAPARTQPPPILAAGPRDHPPLPFISELVAAMSEPAIRATIQRLEDFRTRVTTTDSCRAAADYLAARFAALGLPVELEPFPVGDITAYNVMAEKRGHANPEEIYILCGHYDSMSGLPLTDAPGADDNASGVAAVLESARVLAPVPCEATIRFIAFSGEEQGLIGSRYHVENRVIPRHEDLRGVVNLDMIAFVHPQYPEWDANWYTDNSVSIALAQHVGACVQAYTSCVLHLVIQGNPPYGSDHYWFAVYGYPAIFDIDAQFRLAPDWNYNYHTPADQLITLDVAYCTEMARGALAAVAELARPQLTVALAAPAAPAAPPLARPNPFAESVTFDLGTGPATVRIVDAAGRVVATLAGQGPLTWNGRRIGGEPAPAGVYFYAVAAGAGIGTDAASARARGRLVRAP